MNIAVNNHSPVDRAAHLLYMYSRAVHNPYNPRPVAVKCPAHITAEGVSFTYDGSLYIVKGLKEGNNTATVVRDGVLGVLPMSSVIRARRVIIEEADGAKMRRIPEYSIDGSDNTPPLRIQLHPGVKSGDSKPRPIVSVVAFRVALSQLA